MTSNLFDAAARAKIATISGLGEVELVGLIEAFEFIGARFREIILATPSHLKLGPKNITPRDRAAWLSENVEAPARTLLEALDRSDMLASYPGHGDAELRNEQWSDLRILLTKLRAYALSLQGDMTARIADGATVDAELRCDLVFKLADACADAGIPVTRNYVVGKHDKSMASQIIDLACAKIAGAGFATDHHLRDFIKLRAARRAS